VKLVAVGKLKRPRGNRGELIGEIYSSQPGRADRLKEVVLEAASRQQRFGVEQIWFHGGRPVFKFAGIDSISDAEPWSGADILVPEDERAAPELGEYTHADLIGCKLLGPGELGVVKAVEDYGGRPVLVVESSGGREILVPFARSICREIDVAAKTIRVELPEGLADL
jgi:16S rRNA processing protein RimM